MKKLIIFSLFILGIGFTGCFKNDGGTINSQETVKPKKLQYQNILPKDAKERLESEKNIVLLDVRTVEEHTEKHIPGSILIPLDTIENQAEAKLKDKSAPIFVYCRSGRRSVTASEVLIRLGYANVFNLGGIIDWTYETEAGYTKTST